MTFVPIEFKSALAGEAKAGLFYMQIQAAIASDYEGN
jgi:hypothetical protein